MSLLAQAASLYMPSGPIKGPAPTDPASRRAFVEELRRRYIAGELELDWDGEIPDRLLEDLAQEPADGLPNSPSADAADRTKA